MIIDIKSDPTPGTKHKVMEVGFEHLPSVFSSH